MASEETSTGFPISGGEEVLEMGRSTAVCTTVNGVKMLSDVVEVVAFC